MEPKQIRAKNWLIKNDPEAADFWRAQPDTADFCEAVVTNLRDFGPVPIVPGDLYQRVQSNTMIVVDAYAHPEPAEHYDAIVVFRYVADLERDGATALQYYMYENEFADQYMEV